MTNSQKAIKYLAIALAVFLIAAMVLSVVWIASLFLRDNEISDELKTIELEEEVRSLDLELSATMLTIQIGDAFRVETNNTRIDFKMKGATLFAEEENSFFGINKTEEAHFILTLPADYTFDSVEISAGAGRVHIDSLIANSVDFSFGAGEVQINSLRTSVKTDIKSGAGRIKLLGGSLANLDLDVGVGALTLKAALAGSCSVDCGVGESDITLLGDSTGYTISVSTGLGEITLNDQVLTNGNVVGTGETLLSVSGGIGQIKLHFSEE